MRILKITLISLTVSSFVVPLAHGQEALPPPVHPDTLPTLTQKWKLPASLAPYITNSYTPRIARKGMLLYAFDHHGRRLVAAKAMSGKVVWHAPVPSRSDRGFSVTPLVQRDRVFVLETAGVNPYGISNEQAEDLQVGSECGLRRMLGKHNYCVGRECHSVPRWTSQSPPRVQPAS